MFFRYPIFSSYNLELFTTTNDGGISQGNYLSLNLCPYSGDAVSHVSKNREILAETLDLSPKKLFIPHQMHEDKIKIIDKPFLTLDYEQQQESLHGIDALVTQEKNICIGVTTADCVPVAIYDPRNHALGVAHAGWKGTAAQIAGKTADAMIKKFGSSPIDLLVSIGPSISPQRFEVGDEVGEHFSKVGFDMSRISYRNTDTGKLHINLWEANRETLRSIGIADKNIQTSNICTYESSSFFSARRQSIKSGRMLTGGILK